MADPHTVVVVMRPDCGCSQCRSVALWKPLEHESAHRPRLSLLLTEPWNDAALIKAGRVHLLFLGTRCCKRGTGVFHQNSTFQMCLMSFVPQKKEGLKIARQKKEDCPDYFKTLSSKWGRAFTFFSSCAIIPTWRQALEHAFGFLLMVHSFFFTLIYWNHFNEEISANIQYVCVHLRLI